MRTSFASLTLCACLALAVADVSHLTSSYLPPAKPEQVEQMSIEQHELRELPEQVDYMRENEQGAMELTPSSQLTPPAMPEEEQMLSSRYLPPAETAMPAARYLPPAQPAALPTPAAMPVMHYLPPAQPMERALPEPEPQSQTEAAPEPEPMMQPEMMPMPAMETQPQAAPAMRYLPPAPQSDQYAYQQYQQPEMPYILDVQQPMAPTDAETLAVEPEPAHELRQDGYHYKEAVEEQRLRH